MMKRAVFFFCGNIEKDPVAAHVLNQSRALFPLKETSQSVDDQPVLVWERPDGCIFHYVTTAEVLSHDYGRYLPILNGLFADFSVAGLVNWHAGGNAPDARTPLATCRRASLDRLLPHLCFLSFAPWKSYAMASG